MATTKWVIGLKKQRKMLADRDAQEDRFINEKFSTI